jgi:hypothetical protein
MEPLATCTTTTTTNNSYGSSDDANKAVSNKSKTSIDRKNLLSLHMSLHQQDMGIPKIKAWLLLAGFFGPTTYMLQFHYICKYSTQFMIYTSTNM